MSLEGYVDSCQGGCIFGWVWDPEHPDRRQIVEISLDDTALCRVTAEEQRKDLQDAGIGDGAYAFLYRHPALTYEARERITVAVPGTDFKLALSEMAALDFTAALQWNVPHRAESFADIVKKTAALKPKYFYPVYERLMEPLRSMPLSLLELGIYDGGSLQTWAAYFPFARIAGLDLNPPPLPSHPRIRTFAGDQADTGLLARIAGQVAPDGFDIIIDDCAHIGALAKASFWFLFSNHLKPGGLYIIEDWETGYMPGWPDGRAYTPEPDSREHMPSHDAGMVGFAKQLVDEIQAMPQEAPRRSRFESLTLQWGICIVKKASRPEGPLFGG
jgi:hypothetical protein